MIWWVKEKSKVCWWSWGEKEKICIYYLRYNGKRGSLVCIRIVLFLGFINIGSFFIGNFDEVFV